MNTPNIIENDGKSEKINLTETELSEILTIDERIINELEKFGLKDKAVIDKVLSGGRIISITKTNDERLIIEYKRKDNYKRFATLTKVLTKKINLKAPELSIDEAIIYNFNYEDFDGNVSQLSGGQKPSLQDLDERNAKWWF